MIKLFDIIGLSVLTADKGNNIGIICDILISKEQIPKIAGFILDSKNDKKIFIPWHLLKFGKEFALASLRKSPEDFDIKKMGSNHMLKDEIIEHRVFTNDGRELGLVKDIVISKNNCMVEGFECSDGLINDIINGRTLYPIPGRVQVNSDCIFLNKECVDEAITKSEKEL